MSNARARARQLERVALAPKRITNRCVVPDGALMVARHTDAGHAYCVACGYAVCAGNRCPSAKAGPSYVPMRAYKTVVTQPQPAPAPGAFVVPRGWRDLSVLGDCIAAYAADVGDEENDDCPQVAKYSEEVGFVAWRPEDRGDEERGPFTNPYAAMLCALGCEVREDGHNTLVSGHGHPDCWYSRPFLPAIVERLTAERANEPAVIAECREIRRKEDRKSDAIALDRARQQGEQIGRELAEERDRAGIEQQARIDADTFRGFDDCDLDGGQYSEDVQAEWERHLERM